MVALFSTSVEWACKHSEAKKELALVLISDASGSWDFGAFTSTGEWFQLRFPDSWQELHITVKELLPIVLASPHHASPSTQDQGSVGPHSTEYRRGHALGSMLSNFLWVHEDW